jgi:hypothetical protein
VCSIATQADGIVGLDILETIGVHVDLENRKLKLPDASEHKNSSLTTEADREQGQSFRATLTVFSNSDESGKANRHVKPNSLDMVVTATCEDPLGPKYHDRDEKE